MAEIYASHAVGENRTVPEFQSPPQTRAKSLIFMTNAFGALVSVALIGGIAMWSYKLIMRDVTGIPVVRAAVGEMRVRPENPGGMQASHQGLAVNAVAAEGEAEKPADRLVLAPRPAALTEEDQPISPEMVAAAQQVATPAQAEPAAVAAEEETVAQAVTTEANDDTASPEIAQTDTGAVEAATPIETSTLEASEAMTATETVASVEASVEEKPVELAEVATPEEIQAGTEAAILAALAGLQEEQQEEQQAEPTVAVNAPGVRTSIRPRPRPADGPEMLIRASLSKPVSAPQPSEIDPAKIPTGTRLAQLGAYQSADVAREEWAKLETRFGDFLEGKSRVIEKASSGGRTFYRLRAMGFTDLSDARRFCSTLVAENADCIPVVTR